MFTYRVHRAKESKQTLCVTNLRQTSACWVGKSSWLANCLGLIRLVKLRCLVGLTLLGEARKTLAFHMHLGQYCLIITIQSDQRPILGSGRLPQFVYIVD